METLWQDLRYGLRVLLKKPAFTVVAVITLALGIGATTAIFSVVYSVLLRPLPYKDPERLVELRDFRLPDSPDFTVSPGNFLEWRKQQSVFEQIHAHRSELYDLTGEGEPERITAERITAGMLSMLGVAAVEGRDFLPEEDRPGNEAVAVISSRLWQRRFGGDPNIVGQTVRLNGRGYTVVGVMPKSFQFPSADTELWTPIAFTAQDAQNYGGHYIYAVARLAPGVTLDQARAEMTTIAGRLEQQYPQYNAGLGVRVIQLLNYTVKDVRPALLVLLGTVVFVLLIVCANVANLQLTRAASRQKEIAIRTALGATHFRLVRQLLAESILLSVMGGLLGLLLAYWGVDALIALSPGNIPRAEEIGIDLNVLAFTLGVSVVTGVLFGLVPALQTSKLDLNETLKEGGRSSNADALNTGFRNLLVISEIALSLVLLVGAGLMVKSLLRLVNVETGFNPQNVLTMKLSLPREKYPENSQVAAFYEQLVERARTTPGVSSAGLISLLPLEPASFTLSFTIDGEASSESQDEPAASVRWISPDYFKVMEIPLLKGRFITERDRADTPGAIVINQALARRFFPDREPLGRSIHIPFGSGIRGEVVGVVADVRPRLDTDPRAEIYLSHLQSPTRSLTLVARTAVDPQSLAPALRAQVLAQDPERPVSRIRTMEQVMSASIAERRFHMLLLSIFAALALALAAIGIYGVLSYTVQQNTREIGIRLALGAQSSDVLKLVVGQGLLLAAIGVTAGVGAALGLTRLMATLLYGVTATDPLTYVAVSGLLMGVAAVACYVPARRATKVDPMVALRYE